MLCGASPIPASSGKTVRHRLNRGGNRQTNTALYWIVVVRLRWHQPTHAYMTRRTKEGLSTRERLSRSPWNFGGGPAGDQAASSLAGVTAVAIVWSRVARRAGRCRWPLTRRNCLAASPIPAAIQRRTIWPSCQRLTLAA
jgi:transposase IS116/IS110/IS902 family protein